jgi:serine/threonine protein kinase
MVFRSLFTRGEVAEMSAFEDKVLAERFVDPAPLGQGSFLYKSFVARDKQSDSFVLLKVVSKTLLGVGAADGVVAAARALSDPAVPGVLHLLDTVETAGHVVLVHEYLGGGDLLARCGKWRVPEDEAKTIFMQLLRPVAALHERGRAHGEVRADNVFFGTPLHAFLGDAGVSALFGPAAVRAAVRAIVHDVVCVCLNDCRSFWRCRSTLLQS